jgi:tetratricopeptide (TPR) repeat protein
MIIDPETPATVKPEELAELTVRYPYFSAAHQLLSKVYQRSHDYRFSDQMHHAALYAADRRKLYDYLKSEIKSGINLQATTSEPQRAFAAENAGEVLTEKIVLPHAGAISLAGLIISEEDIHDETAVNTSDTLNAPVVNATAEAEFTERVIVRATESQEEIKIGEKEEENMGPVSMSQIDPMEREILLEAMQSSIELEVTPEHEQDELLPDGNSYASWIFRRSQRLHFGSQSEKNTGSNEEEIIPETASDWLRSETTEETDTKAEAEEDLPAFDHHALSHGLRKLTPPDEKSHQRDLVDRFIRLEPNISRGKASEYSSGNVAKESLEEDFSFVTETMAQLYARQGKLDKARKAYKKLIELYPEKSIYFAAQLKNLDKLKK